MATIKTPTAEEIARRVARYDALQPMSTNESLAHVPQAAKDVVFARRLMPVILDDTKNPFGNVSPITGAAGSTMFVSVMPPGQGPCLHNHSSTFETFMVLEGEIEYEIGEPVAHRVRLGKWDVFSCPPGMYRGFRNVGKGDAVQLTVITGLGAGRDDVSMPDSVARRVEREHGPEVLATFKGLFRFDPPTGAGEDASVAA